MFVKHLTLSHFRNHKNSEIPFEPGITLFLGPNGMGKTNCVEAIEYLSTLSSHKVAGYLPLIMQNEEQSIIRLKACFAEREVRLDVELNREKPNLARLNQSPVKRLRDLVGIVQTVVFTPDDVDIIKRDPSNRRNFIDQLLIQLTPRMAGVIADYERVLKQRNTLLKTARATGTRGSSLSTLDAWDESLIKYGSEIIAGRLALIERLIPETIKNYEALATDRKLPRIAMKSSIVGASFNEEDEVDGEFLTIDKLQEIPNLFRAKLAEVRNKELERGLTIVGPHRDDLVLYLGELLAKGYASNGECWSYALALKLACADLLRQDSRTGDPVIILDDVFAELDAMRRTRLAEMVAHNEQVLITAAAIEDVPDTLNYKIYKVKDGAISNE